MGKFLRFGNAMRCTAVVASLVDLSCHAQSNDNHHRKPNPAAPLQIALTFDDLPSHGQLPPGVTRLDIAQSILATLKREKLPPVYGFVNGQRREDAGNMSMDVLKAWRNAGEPLASHTWSHPDLDEMSAADFEADIAKNEPLLQELAGTTDWHWLRYPYLHEGDTEEKHKEVMSYVKAHGYRVAEVTMDFEDYLWNAPYARCVAKHDDVRVAALHDSYLAVAEEYISIFRAMSHTLYGRDIPYVMLLHIGAFDAKMLPDFIALLRERGFTFVTLQEAMSDPVYNHDPAIGMKGGGALQELDAYTRKIPFPPNAKPYEALNRVCSK